MKKVLLGLILGLTIVSCGKEEDTTPNNGGNTDNTGNTDDTNPTNGENNNEM